MNSLGRLPPPRCFSGLGLQFWFGAVDLPRHARSVVCLFEKAIQMLLSLLSGPRAVWVQSPGHMSYPCIAESRPPYWKFLNRRDL